MRKIITTIGTVGAVIGGIFLYKSVRDIKDDGKLDAKEAIKKCWKPAAVVAGAATTLIWNEYETGLDVVKYSAAYRNARERLDTYEAALPTILGKNPWHDVKDEIAADYIYRDPVSKKRETGYVHDRPLCYDTFSKMYFRCDMDSLRRNESDIRNRLRSKSFVCANEFLRSCKLPSMPQGSVLGWNRGNQVIFEHYTHLANGEPCTIVTYSVYPKEEVTNWGRKLKEAASSLRT
jgi:hypothetical protein